MKGARARAADGCNESYLVRCGMRFTNSRTRSSPWPVTAEVRKMGARLSACSERAHSATSAAQRTRKGRLRTPGFFRIVVSVCGGEGHGV